MHLRAGLSCPAREHSPGIAGRNGEKIVFLWINHPSAVSRDKPFSTSIASEPTVARVSPCCRLQQPRCRWPRMSLSQNGKSDLDVSFGRTADCRRDGAGGALCLEAPKLLEVQESPSGGGLL